jgi:hypothetical protein
MKISGKITGDMVGFSLKHNPENGARFAYVKLAVVVDADACRAAFGKELKRIAFGTLVVSGGSEEDGPAGVSFGYKTLTPAVICEYHELKIAGHTQSVQPVVKSIAPIKDKEEVTIVIEFPILVKKDKALAGDLVAEFGELIEVELDPAQRELDLEGNGNGASAGVVIKTGRFGNPDPVVAGS